MKNNTHSISNINELIETNLDILKNGETKAEKIKARSTIIKLEKLLKDVDYKLQNGKKYPERLYHSGLKPMNKKEIYALIDSVEVDPNEPHFNFADAYKLDLSGVSVGKNRFIFEEKGKVETSILDTKK